MNPLTIARWGRWVLATFPLIGFLLRRFAINKLVAHAGEPAAVRPLVAALSVADSRVRDRARAALAALPSQESRDELVETATTWQAIELAPMILEIGYQHRAAKKHVAFLLAAFGSADSAARSAATKALRALKSPALINGVIDAALDHESPGPLLAALAAAGLRHSVEGRYVLLLALSGRFDDCMTEDFELQKLRGEYHAAPAGLQRRIREAITRAGDTRMNVLFVREKRTTVLGELTGEEAELLVQVNARNRNWDALYKYLQILPARSIASAARAMKQAGYDSDDPDRHALLERLYTLVDEVGDAPAGTRVVAPLGPVLRSWCDRGQSPEFQSRSESDLRAMLNEDVPPPDQLAAMAALAKKGKLAATDLDDCSKSPHWMVRIACSAFGGPPPVSEPGGSLWIERLAPVLDAEAVWGGKPCDVTRDGLEVLLEGLAGLPNRRVAGGLNLVAAVAAHYVAHDIEIDIGAHVLVTEDAIEIEG